MDLSNVFFAQKGLLNWESVIYADMFFSRNAVTSLSCNTLVCLNIMECVTKEDVFSAIFDMISD